jgi:formate/nitrite transporter FocA (FNT family)
LLPNTVWRPLIAKLGYTTGFLIVVLGRQQLFTENTLTVILPLLRRRDRVMFRNVLRLWISVLAANLAGAALFAVVAAHTPVFDPAVRQALDALAPVSMSYPFWTAMVRGIFAGWLIALMVWLLPFAEAARLWVIIIITYIVGLANFTHVIAGSVDGLYLVATRQQTLLAFAGRYLVPTLIGNVIGGVSLVAALAHAQFVAAVERSNL